MIFVTFVRTIAIASLLALMLFGTIIGARAECCDMDPLHPAGRTFQVAAKQQFGRGVSRVSLWGDQTKEKTAIMNIKDRRYLGVAWDKSYLICNYRTKPTVRFFECSAWEGE
jgi:hypothetical protein